MNAASLLSAEVRAVEEGHHARLAAGCFAVVSDTRPGVTYALRVHGYAGSDGLYVTCTCPAGRRASTMTRPVPCKHAALVLRRGERERWARFDGTRWVATGPLTAALATAAAAADAAAGTALLEAM